MSNQTDLDWLARNVHEWPEGKNFICYSRNHGYAIFHEHDKNCAELFTKDQWLSRREWLQNKPFWDSAPDSAEWRAQHSTGYWCWGRGTPTQAANGIWYSPEYGTAQWTGMAGEVLGSWRDTLERRPDAKTRAQAEVESVNAVVEVFQPFTSIEDNQGQVMAQHEKVKQQDNGWFERGELPPVGTECEFVRHDDVDWHGSLKTGHHVEILAHYSPCRNGKKVAVFCFDESVDEDDFRLVEQGIARCFRPIRTEREKAIEEMKQYCPYPGSWDYSTYKQFAEALYDAGYRKESK